MEKNLTIITNRFMESKCLHKKFPNFIDMQLGISMNAKK